MRSHTHACDTRSRSHARRLPSSAYCRTCGPPAHLHEDASSPAPLIAPEQNHRPRRLPSRCSRPDRPGWPVSDAFALSSRHRLESREWPNSIPSADAFAELAARRSSSPPAAGWDGKTEILHVYPVGELVEGFQSDGSLPTSSAGAGFNRRTPHWRGWSWLGVAAWCAVRRHQDALGRRRFSESREEQMQQPGVMVSFAFSA